MESDEDDEETQASFSRFLDDNFKLPISAYAPGCVPKVEIKEQLYSRHKAILSPSTLLIQRFRAAPCLKVCQSNSRLSIL